MLTIDKEFESLIPPLSEDEYRQLEENCVAEGIRDALIIWKTPNSSDVLVDGHNRYRIAEAHGLAYRTEVKEFKDRTDAEIWIIHNQFGRRNLSAYDRSVLALKLKPLIAEKAKENQATHTDQGYQKSDKAEHTAKELARIAGVSHDTIHKVDVIEKKATPEVKKELQTGKTSINKAYTDIKKVEAIENSGNDFVKAQVREGNLTIDQGFKAVRGMTDKSPAQAKKEFLSEVENERKEFQEKKAEGVVGFDAIKKDLDNRDILANEFYTKCLRAFKSIGEIFINVHSGEVDLPELRKSFADEQKKTINETGHEAISRITELLGVINA